MDQNFSADIDTIDRHLTMSRALLEVVVDKLLPDGDSQLDDGTAATLLWQVQSNLDSLKTAAYRLWERSRAREAEGV